MRNASMLTIAPTGTISIIAGTSSGIEPLFALSFYREVMDSLRLIEVNNTLQKRFKEEGIYSESLIKKIAQRGSIQQLDEIPKHFRNTFKTAFDIPPEWHIKMQAVFQRYCDNAVSKTINLPSDASPEEVKKSLLTAHQLKCKGITIYRYGTKKTQVLNIGRLAEEPEGLDYIKVDSEHSGECRECSF